MARTKKNESAAAKALTSTAIITGIITDIYEGEKADYITVKTNTGNKYYDSVKIRDDSGVLEQYNEGDEISVDCTLSTFYDKNKNALITTFVPVSSIK